MATPASSNSRTAAAFTAAFAIAALVGAALALIQLVPEVSGEGFGAMIAWVWIVGVAAFALVAVVIGAAVRGIAAGRARPARLAKTLVIIALVLVSLYLIVAGGFVLQALVPGLILFAVGIVAIILLARM